MIDNLDYEAKNSVGLTQEQKDKFKEFNLSGRYYHFETVDSVCPNGWRLPDTQDWIDYFNFLVKESQRKVKLETIELTKENYYFSFMNYEKRIDLFKKGNSLDLNPTGRIEGENSTSQLSMPTILQLTTKRHLKGKAIFI